MGFLYLQDLSCTWTCLDNCSLHVLLLDTTETCAAHDVSTQWGLDFTWTCLNYWVLCCTWHVSSTGALAAPEGVYISWCWASNVDWNFFLKNLYLARLQTNSVRFALNQLVFCFKISYFWNKLSLLFASIFLRSFTKQSLLLFDLSVWNKQSLLGFNLSYFWNKKDLLHFNLFKFLNKQSSLHFDLSNVWISIVCFISLFLISGIVCFNLNPLPHGVLASFYLTAGGLLRPPEEDDISREKTILMM